MASGASCGEPGSDVIRHVAAESNGALPRGGMAAVAVGRQIAGIIVVDVAGRAGSGDVSASQSEARGGVVEFSRGPRRDRMAGSTHGGSVRESSCDVIRYGAADCGRAVPCGGMAAHAIRGVKRVVIVDVARSARSRRRRHMRANECETGDAMVERCRVPTSGRVARRTICHGESRAGS